MHKVKDDVLRLYEAGKELNMIPLIQINCHNMDGNITKGAAKLGTDEDTFNCILVSRSWGHLCQVISEYQNQYSQSLEQAISSVFSSDIRKGYLAIGMIMI